MCEERREVAKNQPITQKPVKKQADFEQRFFVLAFHLKFDWETSTSVDGVIKLLMLNISNHFC